MHIAHMIKEQYKPTKLSQQNKTHMLEVGYSSLIALKILFQNRSSCVRGSENENAF